MGVAVEGVVGRWGVFFLKNDRRGGIGFFGGRLGLWGVVGGCWEVVRAFG